MNERPPKTPEQIEADRLFMEKIRTVGVNTRKPKGSDWSAVREYRKDDGERIKKTLDEGGNVVTQHARGDRQDVHINAQTVTVTAG